MSLIHSISSVLTHMRGAKFVAVVIAVFFLQLTATGQTFEFPSVRYVDSMSLYSIVSTPLPDTLTVTQGDYGSMSSATAGSGFTIKSILAATSFKVNVQSPSVGSWPKFTYMITYKTIGIANPASPTVTTVSAVDTLTISYDKDSLKLISDKAFSVAGSFHRIKVIVYDVFKVTTSGTSTVYSPVTPSLLSTIPTFVSVFGEINVQKFITYSSLSMSGAVSMTNNVNVNGSVLLNWAPTLSYVKPAGYEIEWTYTSPATASMPSPQYDFRNNATRAFTNSTSFSIPVAQKEGYLVYRVRMVRPSLSNLQERNYGAWTLAATNGSVSGASGATVNIVRSANDSLNWDMKMSFVEDGKYKGVLTYYDGLLKPKQVQTRFNANPAQTIVAHTLFDYEGRPVINSLPIPVNGASRFAYQRNFLRPYGASEYNKSTYDYLPDTSACPPREQLIPPLDSAAAANRYYSRYNSNKTGRNAFLPDAEGYPLTRKIFAAENSERPLFEGRAGYGLQLGNDRQVSYLYGSPLQAELNRYFGQDIGKYNYYRKVITTDNHQQDAFRITDEEGRPVASGIIGTPDTNTLALSVRNAPVNSSFQSNLLPVPNIRMDENWRNTGSYFVEATANYSFRYKIDYKPFKPCPGSSYALMPKVYYKYEVIDDCGNVRVQDAGALGGIGITTSPLLTYSSSTGAYLQKGNHVWNKHSYIKIEDLASSVDQYLTTTSGCYKTFDDFLKDEFLKAKFPCKSNYDPCAAMELAMMRELYPGAKYGQYVMADAVSKTFGGPMSNSIFTLSREENGKYRYQEDCIHYPDTVYSAGRKYWNIKNLQPQQFIDIFCDTLARALLPLHPDYCKLQLCGVVNNPYGKVLTGIKKASDAISVSRYTLTDIINNDPLRMAGILNASELLRAVDDEQNLDTIAFKKTVCGSEYGVVERVCNEINAGKGPLDIASYPVYMQDAYYQKLIALYVANRERRLGEKMNQLGDTCGPCAQLRLTNPSVNTFAAGNDTTLMIRGMDSASSHLHMPVSGSFGSFFDPGASGSITAGTLGSYTNYNNSSYCTDLVDNIVGHLSNCTTDTNVLKRLRDTLSNRFCSNNNTISSLSYDSLTHIFAEVGIATNDLCNAGLVDLRKITNMSGDAVQLGLLHYSPAYYTDLQDFISSNHLLDFIAGGSSSMSLSLALCNTHPFQQNLARQLGATLTPLSCATTFSVMVNKTSNLGANAVELAFSAGTAHLSYFLYPAANGEHNALNTDFGFAAITGTTNLQPRSLFNLYGFDKLAQTYANRNTILLQFDGTQGLGPQQRFTYLLSAFNAQSDYNMMEQDQKEYLNGVGCSEYVQMAKSVVSKAALANIKAGHPYFETFFTNLMNYQNGINFDFDNYSAAMESCGLSDSILIPRTIAHFRIKFPAAATVNSMAAYIDNLINVSGVGITDMQGYMLGSSRYLLLNIYEANGNNINDSRQLIQSSLPVGSVLEYLPYQQRDTIAQILVPDFAPISPSALAAAFPGASISNVSDSMYYFIPGYGVLRFGGRYITITQSIAATYTYNHMVDSVCRFVKSNSPVSAVYTHAESAVSARYNDWQMTAWRNYVNTLTSADHNELVKKSKAGQFNSIAASSGPYSFATSAFSYNNARNPAYINNLYIDHEPNTNSNYNYAKSLLYSFQSANAGSLLKPVPVPAYITGLVAGGTQTRAYVCGDTSHFWINHFDAANKMINIFIRLPEYLPVPRLSYSIVSVSKGFEKDSVTYMNLKLAGHMGAIYDTIQCVAYVNLKLGATYTIPSAFLSSPSAYENLSDKFENCETSAIEALYPAARINYNHYMDSMRTVLVGRFRQHVIDSLQEQLTIIGNDIKHGITLYYYDMAGNLIKTVSPAGVATLNVSGANNDTINAYRTRNQLVSPMVPAHSKVISYRYNAQNKQIQTTTPDAGTTNSLFDIAGRLLASQNARQQVKGECTYFVYDNLSRVIETGVVKTGVGAFSGYQTQPGGAMSSYVKGLSRTEVTVTVYDTPTYKTTGVFLGMPAQENLKNRMACAKYFEAVAGGIDASKDTGYSNALHYTYDISGNVKTLVHDLRTVVDQQLRFKRVDYEYDLYSGKVLMVSYNRGHADQFYQKYTYDADNRLTETRTSSNGVFWDRDARYDYYDHGLLARMELGEQRVQGVDYAYTINGWRKATNGIQNDAQSDMGKDGDAGVVMPRDIFSQRVDYFAGDYKAIKDSNSFMQLPATPKSLYNGNIAGIATALTPFDNIYSKYHYDPLQRIDRAEYNNYNYNYTASLLASAAIPDYASEYRYDADGNLTKLKREGGTVSAAMNGGTPIAEHNMDKFTYRYTPGTNRLNNLQDSSSSTAYKIDVPPTMGDTSLALYAYDPSGSMTKDLVSGLSSIDWNRFDKIRSITKIDGTKLNFSYDPMGNRLAKEVVIYPAADSMVKLKTIYVRDLAGNSLAVYEDRKEFDLVKLTPSVIAATPTLGFADGRIPAVFAYPLAAELVAAYRRSSSDNLAQMAMAVPALDDYASNQEMVQELVSSLSPERRLSFTKSIPAITQYALMGPGEGNSDLNVEKLSAYLQPVMLSPELDTLQTNLFVALKNNDQELYYATVKPIPIAEEFKDMFPANPEMLKAYKDMDIDRKMELINMLSRSLTQEQNRALQHIVPVLVSAYSTDNTYDKFVFEVPHGETILDVLREDARGYITYRYSLPDFGELPFDSVKNQFKYNGVLADALSEQTVAADESSLSAVLGEHFPDVVAMAATAGKGTALASALKVSLSAMDVDRVAVLWLKTQEVWQGDRTYLAEHHIYGSSRLGMQKYLPAALKYEYRPNQTFYQSLLQAKPWYSLYGNDLFSATVYSNDLSTANMGTAGMGINTHILGNRHYELANHLGSVQATVLDRATPKLTPSGNTFTLTGYSADVSTAQDYYPYGMLMPGRYTSDTSKHCVTMSSTIMVAKLVDISTAVAHVPAVAFRFGGNPAPPGVGQLPKAEDFGHEKLFVFHYLPAESHPGNQVVTTSVDNSNNVIYTVDLSGEPSGLTSYLQLHMDTNQVQQDFSFNISMAEGMRAEMRVRQYSSAGAEDYYELMGWRTIQASDVQRATVMVDKNAVLAGGNTVLEYRFVNNSSANFAAGLKISLLTPVIYRTQLVPETRVVTICDEKDNYRFGFNGQEKVNEIAGPGNHTTAMFWEYDTRIARRSNLDPVTHPEFSAYSAFAGNPILYADPNGADSQQRAQAMDKAEEYVEKKKPGNQYVMGDKHEPGGTVDCSGLVSKCVKAGGEKDPNRGNKSSGVLNIESNMTRVSVDEVQPGNVVTFRNEKKGSYPYHVGLVTEVNRNDNNEVTSITFIHSSGGVGPNEKTLDMTATYQYGGKVRVEGFFKWDTKPDPEKPAQTQAPTQPATQPRSDYPSFRQGPPPTMSEKVGNWIMDHSIKHSGLYDIGRWLAN